MTKYVKKGITVVPTTVKTTVIPFPFALQTVR